MTTKQTQQFKRITSLEDANCGNCLNQEPDCDKVEYDCVATKKRIEMLQGYVAFGCRYFAPRELIGGQK